jgi:hypothetical protein
LNGSVAYSSVLVRLSLLERIINARKSRLSILITGICIYSIIDGNLFVKLTVHLCGMGKVKTSLSFDEKLWKEFRKKCIDEGKQYAEVIETLMSKWLK